MGAMCSADKGSAEGQNTEITFKVTGVQSIDEFFDKAKETVDDFSNCLEPVQTEKEKFFEETGFDYVPAARVKHAFNGMFLQLGSQVNVSASDNFKCQGDLDSLKMDWKVDAPFVFLDPTTLGEDGERIYKTFEDYVKALEDCVKQKIPQILKTAQQLPGKAADIKDRAEPEIGKLDPLK